MKRVKAALVMRWRAFAWLVVISSMDRPLWRGPKRDTPRIVLTVNTTTP
jgi:hypothetical protein